MISDQTILQRTFVFEAVNGEYTNHPDDSGGPTRWGITIPVLTRHRGRRCTAEDIKNLTKTEAEKIYLIQFVRPFDGLADPLRVNVIDMGINAGQMRAILLCQQLVGAVVDGVIGAETRMLSKDSIWNELYVGARLMYYESLILTNPKNKTWRNGWRRRALAHRNIQETTRMLRMETYGFMGKAA